MVFRTHNQRPGRAPLMPLVLMGAFFALAGYEYWVNSDRQEQNDSEMNDLGEAKLPPPPAPSSTGPCLMAFLRLIRQDSGDEEAEEVARLRTTLQSVQVSRSAIGEDWPQWRGPRRDGVASGEGLQTDWPEDGPPVLWTARGGEGFSSLAIADGRLITIVQDGGDEVVLCLDAEKGRQLWRFAYAARFTRDGVGPRATPSVVGNHVYTLGARGHLYCLKTATGKEVWHRDLCADFDASLPVWGFACSPLVDGDLLLIHTGAPGASVMALHRFTGKVRWKALDDPAGYSSPVLSMAGGVRQVLFLTGTSLVGLEPQTGRLLWRFPFETPHEANAATPLVRGDYVFVSAGYNQGCALVRIVKNDDGSLEARRVYKNNLMRNHFSSSVFHGEHIYGFDEGYLICLPFR